MELIKSKYRIQYIIKIYLGYALAAVCIGICLNFCRDIYYLERRQLAIFFLLVVICLVIAGTVDIFKTRNVTVKNNKIEIQSFFRKKRIITFSDIARIEKHKVIQRGQAGPITDGYYLSIIILSDGSSFTISPDKFANYNQLMVIIKRSLNKQHIA